MAKSKVVVLIPHYNNLEGLKKSLASISDLKPVDVVVVDDGSSEKPKEKELKALFPQINDIKVIYLPKNIGIEYALNKGLEYILKKGYKYVARLDCGDVNVPERFKIQKDFLEKNSNIYLIGSWVDFVDTKGKKLFTYKPPTKYEEIKKKMFLNSMFIHPSVMFRTDVVKEVGFYPINRRNAEDYAYFFKIIKKFKAANIDKVLLMCEVNPKGLSLSKRKLQIKNRIRIILDNFDFSLYAFYGLIRNLIIYILPYKLVVFLKRVKRDF